MTKKKITSAFGDIDRRDFLNGVAIAVGGAIVAPHMAASAVASEGNAPYPPGLTGMRGSHPGSFEVAHALVQGAEWTHEDTGEHYDLVVVGAGISGLSAAYMYKRDVDPNARILILDNHDDFGGHAKRNEFNHNARTIIGFGGTMLMEAPSGYPAVAKQLVEELGITFNSDESFNHFDMFEDLGLREGMFFGSEVFGADYLMPDPSGRPQDLNQAPLSDTGKEDVARLFADQTDYLADKSPAERQAIMEATSYRDFLRDYAGMSEEALSVMQKRPHGVWSIGADAFPSWAALDSGYPGFGVGAAKAVEPTKPEIRPERLRFPDGNATIARLLVSRLVPSATSARSLDDIITAKFEYDKLDLPDSQVRVRLSSMAVKLKHQSGDLTGPIDVDYVQDGAPRRASGSKVIWAGYHAMLPYVCPDVPQEQKGALSTSVRSPLVYTSVLLDNWQSFAKLGIWDLYCPGSFFQRVRLTHPVSYGSYEYAKSPDDPVVLHMQHIPLEPGLPAAEQFRAGRRQLLETEFSTFEDNVRDQLGRMLGPGGFDPARDIRGITVNRWSHGYAYTTHPETGDVAWYPERWGDEQPWRLARRRIGNIAIAGTDAASNAMSEAAIQEADRAVRSF
ncbi:MAG: NAD(P)/FAD-dependent oxidoreductase [Kordiimonadaceae bacterium]|nr:NAD(P)/FAD-dependent oxidoreductase [Kordiimonadaceae bacterium]MBO6568643.1 NAD(P)/FAD-dependent oxidoreductase [Kordiimonadaceae bacterium]MBO6965381.1 NAD(P)/FAD-dependent oxidoreductase [Kordiimonadaceae bacterium]